MKINMDYGVRIALFFTAWGIVGLDLIHSQSTLLGQCAGVWLGAQAVGIAVHKLGIGIPFTEYWRTCADSPDGGIDDIPNRRIAWLVFGVLDHFWMIKYPLGAKMKSARMVIKR